jgi:hypothetical protein
MTDAPPVLPQHSRWRAHRTLLLTALAAVLLALLLAVVLIRRDAGTYEPLTQGTIAQQPPSAELTDTDRVLHLHWAPGTEQNVTVSLRNSGRRSIRIERTTYGLPGLIPMWLTQSQWGIGRLVVGEPAIVFHPFPVTVKPGTEVLVRLTFTQRRCGWSPGGGLGYPLLAVRTSALGRTHDWSVPGLPYASVDVTAPKSVPGGLQVACQSP